MKYTKPAVYTISDDELAGLISTRACSVYNNNNCSCGGRNN
jgi:hypothetical protein